MEYEKFGKSQLKVSALGLGTAFGGVVTEDSPEVIERALDLGINLIDTAEIYVGGKSEEVIGRVIKDRRDEAVIVTKVHQEHLKYKDVLKSAEGSLKRLGIDTIDLYLVHSPNPNIPLNETMKAMESLVEKGVVRYIGVSNFKVSQLEEAQSALSKCVITANEVAYNITKRDVEADVLPYCQKRGIGIIAHTPLVKGLLAGRFIKGEKIPNGDWRLRDLLFDDGKFMQFSELVKKLEEIGVAHGKTSSQVALNWLATKPGVIPIFGATRISQVEENCGSIGWRMNRKELEIIDRALLL